MTRRGIAVAVGAAGLVALTGLCVLLWYPVGTVPHGTEPLPPAQIWNGLVLALSPVVGLVLAYRPLSHLAVEPRGSTADRRFHLRTWAALLTISSSVPAVGLALHDEVLALSSAVVLYGSFWLAIETQRRLRRPLAPGAWTDAVLDRMRLHLEVLPVAALWLASGLILLALADPDPDTKPLEYLLAIPWLAGILLYRGLWMEQPPPEARGARLLAIGYWVAGFVFLSVPVDLVRIAYLTVGNVTVLAVLERRRRLAVARRREALVTDGYGAALRERYGSPKIDPG